MLEREPATFGGREWSACQTCGACCAYSSDWPRFSMETDAELEAIPERYVADDLSGMRCEGDRCAALDGAVGLFTSCMIYQARPHVCRACQPGDEECNVARLNFGLPPLSAS